VIKLLDTLIGPVTSILDKVVTDKDERARLAHEIATLAERNAHEVALAQANVNAVEAGSKSVFVSGWRPAAGWACVTGMAMNFIVLPLVNLALAIADSEVRIENLDLSVMMPVLIGMLGLATNRTVEKLKNVASG
jgi:hypothetical protein